MREKIGVGREGSLGILQCVLCWIRFFSFEGREGGRDIILVGNFVFAGYLEGLKLKRGVWNPVLV